MRAQPYRVVLRRGETKNVTLHVRNFRATDQRHQIAVRTPAGVSSLPAVVQGELKPESRGAFTLQLSANSSAQPGVQIVAFDITLDGKRYGEYFDLIVEVQ